VTSQRPVIRRGKIRIAPYHVAESRDPADWLGSVVYCFSSPKPSGLRVTRVPVGGNPSLRFTPAHDGRAQSARGVLELAANQCANFAIRHQPISPYP